MTSIHQVVDPTLIEFTQASYDVASIHDVGEDAQVSETAGWMDGNPNTEHPPATIARSETRFYR